MDHVYVNRLLPQMLRPALLVADVPAGTERPTMVTKRPADVLEVLPLIVASSSAGSELDPRFGADYASVQVDVYTDGSEDLAYGWASWARGVLFAAYDHQTVFGAGYVTSFETLVVPWELPDSAMPSNVVRYTGEYRLGVRPAPP